jgi:hypothetical protein
MVTITRLLGEQYHRAANLGSVRIGSVTRNVGPRSSFDTTCTLPRSESIDVRLATRSLRMNGDNDALSGGSPERGRRPCRD